MRAPHSPRAAVSCALATALTALTMVILEIFVDAAWEAVRDDNPSEENYETQLYLNNAAVDFERGTITGSHVL